MNGCGNAGMTFTGLIASSETTVRSRAALLLYAVAVATSVHPACRSVNVRSALGIYEGIGIIKATSDSQPISHLVS